MTSWPQLTEGGSVWLPGPAREALPESPSCSSAPSRGLACKGLAGAGSGRARTKEQDGSAVARAETARPRDNPAHPAPELPLRGRFHEWPRFPDSGLVEPPAARPNQRRQSAWAPRGASVPAGMNGAASAAAASHLPPRLPCRAPTPRGQRRRRGFFSFFNSSDRSGFWYNCVILRLGCDS